MPLAVALLSVSNPTVGIMDTLSRLSHDSDQDVAQNAILALGTEALARTPSASSSRTESSKSFHVFSRPCDTA